MLTIHGRKTSSNVQVVMWAMAEMGFEHERLDVGGHFGGTDTAEFQTLNPMGLVPVLQDGALTLFESQAILRYLGNKVQGNSLWPVESMARARVDQWMEWAKVHIYPIVTFKVFWQLVRVNSTNRDYALISEGEKELEELMKIAEAQLAQHDWLAGDSFSLADISFGTHLYRYFTADFTRASYPHLAAYYKKLCARPAYQAHVMVSYESLRARED